MLIIKTESPVDSDRHWLPKREIVSSTQMVRWTIAANSTKWGGPVESTGLSVYVLLFWIELRSDREA